MDNSFTLHVGSFRWKAMWKGGFEADQDKASFVNIRAYGIPCQIFFKEVKSQLIYYFNTWASWM